MIRATFQGRFTVFMISYLAWVQSMLTFLSQFMCECQLLPEILKSAINLDRGAIFCHFLNARNVRHLPILPSVKWGPDILRASFVCLMIPNPKVNVIQTDPTHPTLSSLRTYLPPDILAPTISPPLVLLPTVHQLSLVQVHIYRLIQ